MPLEPFTPEEEAALFDKVDTLSLAELESYIVSAKNSLGNRALEPTWRPRIELALVRAEGARVKAELVAAQLASQPPVAAPVAAPKAKSRAKAKAAVPANVDATTADEEE